jgi:hypothetical protein
MGAVTYEASGKYDREHRNLRAWWQTRVDWGEAVCHAPVCLAETREIKPGEKWCLGHTADRKGWTGPEHKRCSDQSGLRLADARRRGREQPDPPRWRSSQSWLSRWFTTFCGRYP